MGSWNDPAARWADLKPKPQSENTDLTIHSRTKVIAASSPGESAAIRAGTREI